ncbi:hypothetical protein NSK_003991 [Nannochloropsis salina CCMP1776]|uniref:Uncharacterized protein n=1 Tax=Nannochloropsis salina CCMP1776 TaxID=1027361 RepID=A0A4D9D4L4_9STRA|nr:hypothetical protein NSK_003991 [Nannochloropsis salina CCMP1776]|eukprot:TFJ84963.1 hypothetical protein NSK_003991 [Nannochloropsis salina CCMP1776]
MDGTSTLGEKKPVAYEGLPTQSLPPDVIQAVQEALPTSDPLDRADFDPVDYINTKFPSEQIALEALDPFIGQITEEIGALDTDISQAIEAQAKAGEEASKNIGEAQSAISDLFNKIRDITAKAEQSEVMVQEICRDIKQLDLAKCHLQATITALKRLHMLMAALDQLTFMTEHHHYKEAAQLVDAVRQLSTHFDAYASMPKIAEIKQTIGRINTQLNDQITQAFSEVAALSYTVANPSQLQREDVSPGFFSSLTEACQVVDALGPAARKVHIDDFCNRQLAPYLKAFPKGGEASSLEKIERRFAWCRRALKNVEERFHGVFPAHWKVELCLLMAFLQTTRQHILDTLEAGGPESEDVTVLLKALQKALLFEKEMQPRFQPTQDSHSSLSHPLPPALQEEETSQYAALAKDGKAAEQKKAVLDAAAVLPILGVVSGVFDPFMGPYIDLEKRNMEEMLEKALAEDQVDRSLNAGTKLPVFSSSITLFVYIKTAIKRCTALTTSATFFILAKEFKACLLSYARALRGKLPPANPSSSSSSSSSSAVSSYKLAEGGEVDLEEMVRSKIDPSYAESVSFSTEVDAFHDTITLAIRVLISGLEGKYESAVKAMLTLNWAACEGVGEESAYVRAINDAVRAYVPSVRDLLSQIYFRNFCDKFAQSFLPNYMDVLFRLKRINEMGTQQLLLDVYNLKTLLLQLPIIGLPSTMDDAAPGVSTSAPPAYVKYVAKQFAKIETILKLIGTPVEVLGERYQIMNPEGGAQDLLSIMSLKGMTKKEQQQVLLSCGLDHSLPPSTPEPTASFPPSSLPSSFGTSHAAYPAVGASLDAAKQVAGKGLKVMSEEMRRAFKG